MNDTSYIATAAQPLTPHDAGGKAAALAALTRAGLPVPAFLVIPVDATSGEDAPPWLEPELAQAMPSLGPAPHGYAVRSSAADEDGAGHSFAGQLESYVHVPREDVVDRIIDVWRSGFTDRVIAYRAEHGLTAVPPTPAVIVQPMVDPDCAGVAFSADPVTGRRGVAVVSAVLGLGTTLVGGDADADTYHVDRDGAIIERHIAVKSTAERVTRNGHGTEMVTVDADRAAAPALADADVRAIADLARRASAHFGRPQDIEWAIDNGELFLLQSRPITTIGGVADPDGGLAIWDNSNIIESYAGITTPLTFSFARAAYEEVYRQFCQLMGVPRSTIEANADVFRCMLGLIRGRVYYNLLNWYRLLAMLPGFQANTRFMEQMMGVREDLPPDLAAAMSTPPSGARIRDWFRLGRASVRVATRGLTLPRRSRAFHARLDEALSMPVTMLCALRADELVAVYRDLERQLLAKWDAPIINDFFAMIFHGALRRLCASWCGDERETLHNDLLCGEGGMISTEPARRLRAMATLAQDDTELVDTLCSSSPEAALSAIDAHPELRTAYDEYLKTFGDRCLEELKLESLTLDDDPRTLLRGIGHLARRLRSSPPAEGIELEMRRSAETQAAAALRARPLHRIVFRFVLRNARHRVRDRENLRFERTRVFGRVRRIFVELGRRLHELDLIDAPRDVFFLEVEEVIGFVVGTTSTTDLRGLIALRAAEFASYGDMDAPDERFETHGPVYHGHAFHRPPTPVADRIDGDEVDEDVRTGLACCPGVVRTVVRVVRDPNESGLETGEILVAERTDPGWITIFPAAAGLLVERGSLLSHSAIVAREMGIPAIVSIPGVMEWLRDGDVVEMDGATGTIRRVHDEEADP